MNSMNKINNPGSKVFCSGWYTGIIFLFSWRSLCECICPYVVCITDTVLLHLQSHRCLHTKRRKRSNPLRYTIRLCYCIELNSRHYTLIEATRAFSLVAIQFGWSKILKPHTNIFSGRFYMYSKGVRIFFKPIYSNKFRLKIYPEYMLVKVFGHTYE